MKKRSDGVYHFDGEDDSYIQSLLRNYDPTYGGAVNQSGLVSLQNIIPVDRSPAPSGGFGFPVGVGTVPFQLPGDAGGPTAEGEPTYATEDAVIAQIASANQIPIEEATQQYYNFIGQPTPATPSPAPTPPPAPTSESLFDGVLGGAQDAVTAVGGVIDTGLKQLGDLIGMGDPSLVVLNPVNPTASVVYGTPTGSATPTIIGNMPKSGAPIGVITGIPALDNILSGVFSQRGQGGASVEEIIRGIVLDQIGKETGYPVAGVAGAVGGGLSGDLNKVIDSVGKVVLQIDKKVEAADNDPFSIIKGPSPDGQMEPIKTVATGEDMRIGGGGVTGSKENQNKVTPTSGIPTGEDMLIGGGEGTKSKENKVTPTPPTPSTPTPEPPLEEILTILGETPEPETVTSTPSTPGAPSTPTPLYGLGVRSMKTEKAGVTPLEDVFDIGDMSLANVLRLLAGEDDNTQGTPYYGGGSVNRANSVDELIRLLRG